jgi:hypothetical protein
VHLIAVSFLTVDHIRTRPVKQAKPYQSLSPYYRSFTRTSRDGTLDFRSVGIHVPDEMILFLPAQK